MRIRSLVPRMRCGIDLFFRFGALCRADLISPRELTIKLFADIGRMGYGFHSSRSRRITCQSSRTSTLPRHYPVYQVQLQTESDCHKAFRYRGPRHFDPPHKPAPTLCSSLRTVSALPSAIDVSHETDLEGGNLIM